MEYNWGISNLIKDKEKLIEMINNCSDSFEKIRLEMYLRHLEQQIYLFNRSSQTIKTFEGEMEKSLTSYYLTDDDIKCLWDFIEVVAHYESLLKYYEPPKPNETKTNDPKIIIQHVFNFFKDYTPEKTFKQFLSLYDNFPERLRFDQIANPNANGNIIFVGGLNKAYINSKTGNVHVASRTLIHESGHGTHFLSNPEAVFSSDFFSETPSLFYELISIPYFKKVINPEEVLYNMTKKFLSLGAFATRTLMINETSREYIDKEFKSGDAYKRYKLKMGMYEQYACVNDYLLNGMSPRQMLTFCYSFLAAVELYEIYLSNPDKAFEKLNEFMFLNDDAYEVYHASKIVTLGESLDNYANKITGIN